MRKKRHDFALKLLLPSVHYFNEEIRANCNPQAILTVVHSQGKTTCFVRPTSFSFEARKRSGYLVGLVVEVFDPDYIISWDVRLFGVDTIDKNHGGLGPSDPKQVDIGRFIFIPCHHNTHLRYFI